MRRWTAGTFAVLVALMGLAVSAAASDAHPRWVRHVHNYPGGISNGVRAYLTPGVRSADKGMRQSSGSASKRAALDNLKVNTFDANPGVPQNETQVAVNEDHGLNAVAGANDYVNGGSQLYATQNGGQTWTTQFRSSAVFETGDFCGGGGDPALTYSDRDQAFYFAQLCFFRNHSESEVEVLRSTDRGQTWTGSRDGSYPVTNFDEKLGDFDPSFFYDKEQITVDNNPSSPHYGRLYVTYIKFHIRPNGFSDYCPAQVAYTDNIDPDQDGKLSDAVWRHTALMPDNPGDDGVGRTANQGAQPVVDTEGGLDIAFMSEDCNTGRDRAIFFRRSVSGGHHFGRVSHIDEPGEWQDNPDPDDVLPNKNAPFAASTSAPLVFNPVDDSLDYIVQNNVNRRHTGADISFTKSLNFGRTWSDMVPVAVNGSGQPAHNDQMFPWMAVDPSGHLQAIWFDNRNDPANRLIETFQGVSTDGGQTWANRRISTTPWDPNESFFSSGAFVGDYNGLAASPDATYPVWTDGRDSPGPPNGDTDIWTNVELGTPP
jgi:hypothetical protein